MSDLSRVRRVKRQAVVELENLRTTEYVIKVRTRSRGLACERDCDNGEEVDAVKKEMARNTVEMLGRCIIVGMWHILVRSPPSVGLTITEVATWKRMGYRIASKTLNGLRWDVTWRDSWIELDNISVSDDKFNLLDII